MPKISQQKKDKISEQILHYLFSISPTSAFTASVSKEIARDEEFTKSLLTDLSKKNLIIEIKKNPKGLDYLKRQRWTLTSQAFDVYKKHQDQQPQSLQNNSNPQNPQTQSQ